jgi:hypothetical protein
VSLGFRGPSSPNPADGLQDAIVTRIEEWVSGPTLIAIDAPLGRPADLGEELVEHRAGNETEKLNDFGADRF